MSAIKKERPSEARPFRLQLSRAKGFNLQAHSMAANGLPAVKVDRTTQWGNPFDFRASEFCWLALTYGCRGDATGRQEASVKAFLEWIAPGDGWQTQKIDRRVVVEGKGKQLQIGASVSVGPAPELGFICEHLRGKNLACWCKPSCACHADVLLDLANSEPTP